MKGNRMWIIGLGLCMAAVGGAACSAPTGKVGREAGLWRGEVRIQNLYLTGKDADVQRLVEESTGTSCQPEHPHPTVDTDEGTTAIRRVIEIPEDGMTIIVEVPRKGGAFSGPLSVIVRRQPSAEVMTEDVLRAQPSLLRPELGVDVNAGSWVFTRLGDCPPGMKPFEKLPAP